MTIRRNEILNGTALVIAIVCLVVLIGLPSHAQAKPDNFPIALLADLTGPYAAVVGPTAPGVEDAVEYVNKELGGIDGVPIKSYIWDNKGQVSIGMQQYAELVELKPRPKFVGVWHASTFEAMAHKLPRDKIIGFGSSNVTSLYPPRNSYGSYPTYGEMVGLATKVARDMWKEKRNPRAAVLTWDTTLGHEMLTPEFLEYIKSLGIDVVAKELFGIRDADVTTQMVRIRAKKADYILTCIAGGGFMAIMKAAKDLGMDNVTLISHNALEMIAAMRPELFEGSILSVPIRSFFDTGHPGIQTMLRYMKKNNRSPKEKTIFYSLGWAYTLLAHHVTQKAVAKVGWDKLDTAALKYEMNHLVDFAPLNGITRLTFTDERRTPRGAYPGVITKTGYAKYLIDPKGKYVAVPDLRPAKFR